jgi:hypothetical protein
VRSTFITTASIIALTVPIIASILLKRFELGGFLLSISVIGLFLAAREPQKPRNYVFVSIASAWAGVVFLGVENGPGAVIFGAIMGIAVSYAGVSLLRGKLPKFAPGKRA